MLKTILNVLLLADSLFIEKYTCIVVKNLHNISEFNIDSRT